MLFYIGLNNLIIILKGDLFDKLCIFWDLYYCIFKELLVLWYFFFFVIEFEKNIKKIEFIFIELNNIIIVLRFILDGWIDMYEILSMDLVILFY